MATTMRSASLAKGKYKRVAGKYYGTPKEVWGFRTPPLRPPADTRGLTQPERAARHFVARNAALFGLGPELEGIGPRKLIRSLGAHHVILEQRQIPEEGSFTATDEGLWPAPIGPVAPGGAQVEVPTTAEARP